MMRPSRYGEYASNGIPQSLEIIKSIKMETLLVTYADARCCPLYCIVM